MWLVPLLLVTILTTGVDSPAYLDTVHIAVAGSSTFASLTQRAIALDETPGSAHLGLRLHGQQGLYVQQSQAGGGSPILRGFEANRLLLAAEGLPLNMTIFRSGHLHNLILWPPCFIEQTEIHPGPTSAQWGSDALGGTINLRLRAPTPSWRVAIDHGLESASRAYYLCGLVSDTTGLVGLFYQRRGAVRAGKRLPAGGERWLRPWYVVPTDSQDYLVSNPSPYVQLPSGYDHAALLARRRTPQRDSWFFATVTSAIPRYDRLTLLTPDGLPKYAEWFYGPHIWLIGQHRQRWKSLTGQIGAFFYQESRHRRRFQDRWRWNQYEQVLGIRGLLTCSRTKLRYGLRLTTEYVRSFANYEHTLHGIRQAAPTRYPHGGSWWATASPWLQYQTTIASQWKISLVLRQENAWLHARMGRSRIFYPFLPERIRRFWWNWAAAVHLTRQTPYGRYGLLLRKGYKFPNLDDLAKIFDSRPGQVFLPDSRLRPEEVYGIEAPILFQRTFLTLRLSPYLNWLQHPIGGLPTTDSLPYENEWSAIVQVSNLGAGYNYGLAGQLTLSIAQWQLTASGQIVRGMMWTDTDTFPMAHIPPASVLATLQYPIQSRLRLRVQWYWQDAKPATLYNPSGEDNLDYALPYGLPAVQIWNLGFIWQPHPHVHVFMGIDNLLDTHWRAFASGISAPGRNFILNMRIHL